MQMREWPGRSVIIRLFYTAVSVGVLHICRCSWWSQLVGAWQEWSEPAAHQQLCSGLKLVGCGELGMLQCSSILREGSCPVALAFWLFLMIVLTGCSAGPLLWARCGLSVVRLNSHNEENDSNSSDAYWGHYLKLQPKKSHSWHHVLSYDLK